jgi:hypothetical protein
MPLPVPQKGQSRDEFVSQCMSNETMKKEFPKASQRVAVCLSQWARKKPKEGK